MDRSWLSKPTLSPEYQDGIQYFLGFARRMFPNTQKIVCPCSQCSCSRLRTFDIVKEHLVCNRFLQGYNVWYCHGESFPSSSTNELPRESHSQTTQLGQQNEDEHDDMQALIEDALGMPNFSMGNEDIDNEEMNDESSMPRLASNEREARKFRKLVEDANEELYKGCKNFSRLSFIVRLFHIKCMNGWSSKSFSMLMGLLSEAFPDCNLPNNAYGIKQFLKSFGLQYEKIHACPNDCMLYRGDSVDQQSCYVCGASRYECVPNKTIEEEQEQNTNGKRKCKPAKVLRYFPLIPRLQRLFMSSKTSSTMRWHHESRKDDGFLRHPADSLVWKSFDEKFPAFSSDHRNVRLGLASDGFNPFRQLSTVYSTWPVILIPYNMPPWVGMKQSSFIMSMIIPGPKGPGNDIDVYLEPLVEELNQLWVGIDTFDATSGETFKMKAALLWTINDFPAFSMMSGQTTKGRFACPTCGESTRSHWLVHGKKFCYMGHRRWLEKDHKFRMDKDVFDGSVEHEVAPIPLSGNEVLRHVDKMNFAYGKGINRNKLARGKRKVDDDAPEFEEDDNPNDARIWKKRSIFFKLPYWQSLLLRHNIDFMHTEKNVAVNFIGTILGVPGVSKDNEKARLDLVDMFIRHELHPVHSANGKRLIPPACYTMSKKGKSLFLKVLKNLKLPDGYASNISKSVNEKESRLQALKSHDFHILMQDLLPVAIRRSLPKHVAKVIIEVCNIFKGLCSKVLDIKHLEVLESRAALALCKLEKIFVPSFFTIMVHLVIHLASEAKIAGPVHYRWMYPFERFYLRLKGYVKNRTHPEGSMAEGFLDEECAIFCSLYLEGIETRFSRPRRNEDTLMQNDANYMFASGGRPMGKVEMTKLDDVTWVQAHRYILFQHEGVKSYVDVFLREVKDKRRPGRYNEHELNKIKNDNFHSWFTKHVSKLNERDVSLEIRALSTGPNKFAARCKSFIHNGRRFHTKTRELHLKTQNSGILVTSKISSYASSKDKHPVEGDVEYYGVLTDIIELDYNGVFKVVLFKGGWVDIKAGRGVKVDDLGFTLVNLNRLMYNGSSISHEPFVISSQVQQVVYIQDPVDEDWHVVLKTSQRDAYDMGSRGLEESNCSSNDNLPIQPSHLVDINFEEDDEPGFLVRVDTDMDGNVDDDLSCT